MEWAVYLVVFVVTAAMAVALAPKQPTPSPASLDDINFPTAEPGRPIPVAFGTVTIRSPNVVWYGDLATSPIKTKGGK